LPQKSPPHKPAVIGRSQPGGERLIPIPATDGGESSPSSRDGKMPDHQCAFGRSIPDIHLSRIKEAPGIREKRLCER